MHSKHSFYHLQSNAGKDPQASNMANILACLDAKCFDMRGFLNELLMDVGLG